MMEEAFDYLNAPIIRVTGLDVPIPSGPLHFSVVPDKNRIIKAIQELMRKARMTTGLSVDQLLARYHLMVMIRAFEESAIDLFAKGLITDSTPRS